MVELSAWTKEPQVAPLSGVFDADIKKRLEDSVNLMNNTMRGLVAEVLVATAMDGEVTPPWDPWDVNLKTGERVEVKATGLFQAWAQDAPSIPAWSISEAAAWVEDAGELVWEEAKTRRSNLYLFCLHTGVSPGDPAEWEFRPVDTSAINETFASQSRVRMTSLDARLSPPILSFDELAEWNRKRSCV